MQNARSVEADFEKKEIVIDYSESWSLYLIINSPTTEAPEYPW